MLDAIDVISEDVCKLRFIKKGGFARKMEKINKIISGTHAAKDCILKGCLPSTQTLYDRARDNEKKITKTMCEVAQNIGAKMTQLEHSVKTASSVANKIERLTAKGLSEEQAMNSIKDTVRYTQLGNHNDLVNNVLKTQEQLEQRDYEIIELDNKYLTKDAPYKGIHMTVISPKPERQVFELQFHSQESLEIKNKNHHLYEKYRKIETSDQEKENLKKQMKENTEKLKDPESIETLKSY